MPFHVIRLIAISPHNCYTQTHTLPGTSLAKLATLYVEAIKAGKMGSGKSLELFPTVLTALSACEALSYGKGECKIHAPVTLLLDVASEKKLHGAYRNVMIFPSVVVAFCFMVPLGELSGGEYKKQLINSLCSSR